MGSASNITPIEKADRPFQVFVKPIGASCNLNCSYCYYLEKNHLYKGGVLPHMNNEVLESYIQQQINACADDVITFSWHGGEPLLAGIAFYKKAVGLQKKYLTPGRTIVNGIQTNGTLLNAEWCGFFAMNNFIVGLSMDGPEEFHNHFRKVKDGSGSFKKVLHGYDLLVMHGLEPEILCVITTLNAGFPLEIYRFFRDLGVTYITFIPFVKARGDGTVSSDSVTPEAFGEFLCTIFDEWLTYDIGKLKVQIFEEALRTAFKQEHTLCIFKPNCGTVPVVEANGDFYVCDHFTDSGHKAGNICNSNLAALLNDARQKNFGQAKYNTLPEYCKKCEVLDMCNGECMKNRLIMSPDGEQGLNYLCKGYKRFFNYCRPFIKAVADAYNVKNNCTI